MLMNVFKGMTPEQVRAMSPEEIITRVYDHLIANVDRYWESSSVQVRESVRKRLVREKELLLAMEMQKKEAQRQAKVQSDITQKMMGDYDEVRKQERGLVFGDWGYGREVEEMTGLSEGGVQGIAQVLFEKPYWMPEIMDVGIEKEQEEARRRVIDVDVRREMEVVSGIGEVLEKALAPVVGRVGGGVGKVNLPGGDAFSKVPLFPEDVGLVMMMMGLV
jgi:hypothetical protein